MRYLQTSYNKNCIFDRKTNKFMQQTEAALRAGIEVPFFLWQFEERREHTSKVYGKPAGVFRQTHDIELNHFKVKFIGSGPKSAEVRFFDSLRGSLSVIEIDAELCTVSTAHGIDLIGVTHTVTNNGDTRIHRTMLSNPAWVSPNFCRIPGLGCTKESVIGRNRLSLGVLPSRYIVRYRGKKLNGNSYALVSGTWAVLLGDDMSFDSIVILNGATQSVLEIDQVAYTVNPYMVKVMTMIR